MALWISSQIISFFLFSISFSLDLCRTQAHRLMGRPLTALQKPVDLGVNLGQSRRSKYKDLQERSSGKALRDENKKQKDSMLLR